MTETTDKLLETILKSRRHFTRYLQAADAVKMIRHMHGMVVIMLHRTMMIVAEADAQEMDKEGIPFSYVHMHLGNPLMIPNKSMEKSDVE